MKYIKAILRLRKVFYAANCAFWLLEQKEFQSFINGQWGDPEAIRDLLKQAGCKPSCRPKDTL